MSNACASILRGRPSSVDHIFRHIRILNEKPDDGRVVLQKELRDKQAALQGVAGKLGAAEDVAWMRFNQTEEMAV